MKDDRRRTGDWDRTEWESDVPEQERVTGIPPIEREQHGAEAADRWVKTQWPGDQGEGDPAPVDPDDMPEGEAGLSGDRHAPSEQHWARGQSRDPS